MAGMGELGRKRDIDKGACDRPVGRLPAVKGAGDSIERIALMEARAGAPPIGVAEGGLRCGVAYPQPGTRPKIVVGQMCEQEGFAHDGCSGTSPATTLRATASQAAASLISIAYLLFSYELPMRIPAAKTRTPPTTTWNAAARNGV